MKRYNPPPGWPLPPPNWSPPTGWQPDPSWPEPPPGWPLWIEDAAPRGQAFKTVINPPPGWPLPPPNWAPPEGWQPDPSWPEPPPGWPLWIEDAAPHGQAFKTVIRFILVLAMILEGIVALGHFGDLSKQSTGEWLLLEIMVLAVFIGTILLFRFVGSHWETMPTWGKFLTGTPVLASLWFIGPAIALVALIIATIAFVIYLFKNGYMTAD